MTLYGRKVGKSSLMTLIGSQSISRTMEPKTTCRQAEKHRVAVKIPAAASGHPQAQSPSPPSALGGGEGGESRRRGSSTDHRENEPPQVSVNRKVNHLLNRVKVWIIQVPEKPQNTWSEDLGAHKQELLKPFGSPEPWLSLEALSDLSQQQDEGGKVKDVDHAHQPVEEHGGTRGRGEALLPVLQRGVKHLLQATNAHLTGWSQSHDVHRASD